MEKATTLSVLIAAIASVVLSLAIKFIMPELAYIHRMGMVFFISGFACFLTAYLQGYQDQIKAINLSDINFSTSKAFNTNWVIITVILALTYLTFG